LKRRQKEEFIFIEDGSKVYKGKARLTKAQQGYERVWLATFFSRFKSNWEGLALDKAWDHKNGKSSYNNWRVEESLAWIVGPGRFKRLAILDREINL
jgi:hypothetical protein